MKPMIPSGLMISSATLSLPRKSIVKFPDFLVSSAGTEFGASKSALYAGSAFFQAILDQSPDLCSCSTEIPIQDYAVELVLRRIHGQAVDIGNDCIIDCLHLGLKWAVPVVKSELIPRVVNVIDPVSAERLIVMAKEYECGPLLEACNEARLGHSAVVKQGIEKLRGDVENSAAQMEAKFIAVIGKTKALEGRVAELEQNPVAWAEKVDAWGRKLEARMEEIAKKVAQMDGRIGEVQKRLDVVERSEKEASEKQQSNESENDELWEDSNIMTEDDARSIVGWLPDAKGRAAFCSIYKGSTDGFTSGMFHKFCDGFAPTLTVIKSKAGLKFGGYTSVPWDGGKKTFAFDSRAFTFSLTYREKCPVITNPDMRAYAVMHCASYGPVFGKGNDILISARSDEIACTVNEDVTYKLPSRMSNTWFYANNGNFLVEEIEVYRVVYNP